MSKFVQSLDKNWYKFIQCSHFLRGIILSIGWDAFAAISGNKGGRTKSYLASEMEKRAFVTMIWVKKKSKNATEVIVVSSSW